MEATPANLGTSFLLSLYTDLYRSETPDLQKNRAYHFILVEILVESLLNLRWWEQTLIVGLSKQVQGHHMVSLAVIFGDECSDGIGGRILGIIQ